MTVVDSNAGEPNLISNNPSGESHMAFVFPPGYKNFKISTCTQHTDFATVLWMFSDTTLLKHSDHGGA